MYSLVAFRLDCHIPLFVKPHRSPTLRGLGCFRCGLGLRSVSEASLLSTVPSEDPRHGAFFLLVPSCEQLVLVQLSYWATQPVTLGFSLAIPDRRSSSAIPPFGSPSMIHCSFHLRDITAQVHLYFGFGLFRSAPMFTKLYEGRSPGMGSLTGSHTPVWYNVSSLAQTEVSPPSSHC